MKAGHLHDTSYVSQACHWEWRACNEFLLLLLLIFVRLSELLFTA